MNKVRIWPPNITVQWKFLHVRSGCHDRNLCIYTNNEGNLRSPQPHTKTDDFNFTKWFHIGVFDGDEDERYTDITYD